MSSSMKESGKLWKDLDFEVELDNILGQKRQINYTEVDDSKIITKSHG